MIRNPSTPSPKPYIHRSRSATFDSPTRRPSTSPYSKSSSHLFNGPTKLVPSVTSSRVLIQQLTLPTRATQTPSPSPSSPSTCSTLSSVAEASDSDEELESDVEARAYVTAPSPPPSYASLAQSQRHPRVRALHEDPDSEFIDPWLVRVVLDLYDVRRYDWTMIAEPIQRVWGISTSSAIVLAILQRNGRIARTAWWD
ncbi:uncharacterized protein BDZ99DRAFT_137775 [Mytilinidion resinicola]|uniref:Uncharacterized protein n=1 Tax=Mytilinidion resinicola TaxID=574789 RepID=A0A6A6Z6R8_9PEZI|nr:uncharacterized protein BDZ99DRAFT_137775 [Mytilinidion resinicola]KAF2816508.1 hypothetical protein BDZ99DRAFT_137775 [Mytilinidion resinicola]